ncbi:MAG: CgeB family protein [Bryobacteraceae bacterium]
MRVIIFCHSLLSDWNHGNAHFLRGISSELLARGHSLAVFEPENAWSLRNLLEEQGDGPVERFHAAYPMLRSHRYERAALDLDEALQGADLVLVHEWNDPELVRRIGRHRKRSGRYILLFHDTHHRSVTDPVAMRCYELEDFDGVLAFGASVAEQYMRHGWGRRAWVWHEAADTRIFYPRPRQGEQGDLVWIGNWGDDERARELKEFLVEPAEALGLRTYIRGVRYPREARETLERAGIGFGGWVANYDVPELFAQYRFTVHVPRRPYAEALPGVPTIRIFEALACGIPLVSAPWNDSEGLFHPGLDFLTAQDAGEMKSCMRALHDDPALRKEIAGAGFKVIKEWHTCAHRVAELMQICEELELQTERRIGAEA